VARVWQCSTHRRHNYNLHRSIHFHSMYGLWNMNLRDSTVHCSDYSTRPHRLPYSILRLLHNPTPIRGQYSTFEIWDRSTSCSRSAAGPEGNMCRRRCNCSLIHRLCRRRSIAIWRGRSSRRSCRVGGPWDSSRMRSSRRRRDSIW
jgi:hypothetical protein